MKQIRCEATECNSSQMDQAEREQLIFDHMTQVEHIAKRIYGKVPANVELGDLISAGTIGLLDAVEKYDPARGIKFKTFSEHRIRGAMLDSLRDLDWAPRSLRAESRALVNLCRSLEQRLGRAATDEEKCQEQGISLEEFHQLSDKLSRLNVGSLESTTVPGEKDGQTLLKRIPDGPHMIPSNIFERSETREILISAIDALPRKERLVVSLYYYDELTMLEIGEILGVNESRISQLHSRAMQRLRTRLRGLERAA
jgi:RNA polymerase sigma factor for flagellar operon FliA